MQTHDTSKSDGVMSTANGDVAIQAPSEPREDESKKIRKDYRRILEDLDEKARQEEEEDGGNRPDGEDEEDEEEESGGVFSETAKQLIPFHGSVCKCYFSLSPPPLPGYQAV